MTPKDHVLFPTDLSPSAAAALPYAGRLAEALRARLVVYYVAGIPVAEYAAWGAGREDEVWARVDEGARRALLRLTGGLAAPVEVVVRHDAPSARVLVDLSLLDEIRRSRPALVVMPMHGRTGFERFFVGSVTEEVVRNADVPVLAVRDPERRAAGPLGTMVVATDLSPASRSVFPMAGALARALRSRVVVVHAAPGGAGDPGAVRAFAGDALGEAAVRVMAGPAWRAVVRVAEEESADLVAVGRRGADGDGDGLLGTTTDRVLRRASCPVLVG